MGKPRIGVSSCLLGNRVRYDGGHKFDRYVSGTLGAYFEWVPVCPEVECGLSVPREAMRLRSAPQSPRLVTVKTRIDHTERMMKWAADRLENLKREKLCGFIFKSRSPSSGIAGVRISADSGFPGGRGAGIFGGAFVKRFPLVPVIDESRLHDPDLRENFVERVFVYKSWREFNEGASAEDLVTFHAAYKLLIMSHSPKHLSALGRVVSGMKGRSREEVFAEYISC